MVANLYNQSLLPKNRGQTHPKFPIFTLMKTIEIRTTQNVSIDYELANLTERIMAYFLDFVIYFVSYFIVIMFFISVLSPVIEYIGEMIYLFFALFTIAGWVLYNLLMEVFNQGQTIGKRVMAVQVVRVDGKEPAFTDHLLRSVFMLVDSMFSFGVVASVLIASSEKGQRFGDMAANTTVVRRKVRSRFLLQDILKISSLADYEPSYPEVRQLSESDMLLIKNVVNRYEAFQNDSHRVAVRELVAKLTQTLGLKAAPKNSIEFLKTLIRDYIVLTR